MPAGIGSLREENDTVCIHPLCRRVGVEWPPLGLDTE